MKNEELYHKTIGILVKAYQNDTLRKYDCAACVVGNMIAANEGYAIGEEGSWLKGRKVILPAWWPQIGRVDTANNNGEAKRQMDSTGYTLDELSLIETAFEGEGDNFNGLMAVVDALDIIHENTDKEVTKLSKNLFQI